MEVYSGFVYCKIIRLNHFFSNDAFLDKEESCNKLVVLKYFCAWYVWHASRMKMVDFHPISDSLKRLKWLEMWNPAFRFSRKDKTISRNKLHYASTFRGVYLYAKVERILSFKNLPYYVWFLWKVALKQLLWRHKRWIIASVDQ